jgi:hypothetical protein
MWISGELFLSPIPGHLKEFFEWPLGVDKGAARPNTKDHLRHLRPNKYKKKYIFKEREY